MKPLFVLILFCIAIFMINTGCSLSNTVTVTGLGWFIENIPQSYWSSPSFSTCFCDFWIYYSGTFSLIDVEYARIYNPDKTWRWDIPLIEELFTSEYIGGWYQFGDGSYPNTFPIGNLTAEIKLKNGSISSFVKLIPAPGNTTTLGYERVYTEECLPQPLNSISMIKRPSITGSAIDYGGQNISINFTIIDDRVYSGWVWLLDSSSYAGYTTLTFRDEDTGDLTSIINSPFYTDGTENTISITNADLTFNSGYSFSDISEFIVIVTDGEQYAPEGRYYAYDCRALSETTEF